MSKHLRLLWILTLAVPVVICGCEREEAEPEPTEPPATAQTPEEPAEEAPAEPEATKEETPEAEMQAPEPAGETAEATELALEGVLFTMPAEWSREEVPDRPMAPVAVLNVPASNERTVEVRITHFPKMKGMDEQNIDRWLRQFRKQDGAAMTRDDAEIRIKEMEGVKLTIVDLTGAMQPGMPGSGAPQREQADQRMIAAIVDHANGPHYVKAVGDADAVAEVEDGITAFLESAKAGF